MVTVSVIESFVNPMHRTRIDIVQPSDGYGTYVPYLKKGLRIDYNDQSSICLRFEY